MGDLITRKAAVSRISDLLILELNGERIQTWNEVYNAIGDIPSVSAVPLDKLCEWLAERYEPPYALIDIDKLRRPIDFRQQKGIWMAALTKWMEEQDAADRCRTF